MTQNQQNKPVAFQSAFLSSDTDTDLSNSRTSAYFVNPFSYRISISWFGGVHIYPKFR